MFDIIDSKAINTIRTLSIDAINKANSGHPGLPMGAAPMAYVLWTKHLKINPLTSRNWVDRDRFILSAGHGSAMLYSLLHLAGYKVSIEDLKQFRQWNSNTPGHPEVHHVDGVEATTGPLGQGIAMAVGMAMSEAHLAAIYNKPNYPIVDHYTYVLCGDGDLMEGVSQEASSMAGHMKLGKLIVLYDSNDISLDGPTSKSFTENVGQRYEANGWQYILVEDGTDLISISSAIEEAKKEKEKPTLIEVKTIIGYGASNQGTSAVHGSPIGEEEAKNVKEFYGFNKNESFTVAEDVRARFIETITSKGVLEEDKWNHLFSSYKKQYPELASQFESAFADEMPKGWDNELPVYEVGQSSASRMTSKETIHALSKALPNFWGGSADLSASNNTMVMGEKDFEYNHYEGKNIWFGVREFAMTCALNGIILHGGTKVYGGTFFVFVDYLRAALRLAAIQKNPITLVLTHDSIAVGEDGPTHEPIEQLSSLRSIPNVQTFRPADGNEVVAAWKVAITSKETPTVLALTRQNLPVLEGTKEKAHLVSKGAYVLSSSKKDTPDGIIIASGSEVYLAMEAQKLLLAQQGEDIAVVSMPCMEVFEKQDAKYKESVLPKCITKRVAVEMGASFGWDRYVGINGKTVTIDHFGASAPADKILREFGFTVENIVNTYHSI
ncbi:transketolase [Niallia nealsonii]|uniref:Transketolase n=1 Tax=Niallia nealsonii TaxID=115979 RepID=A0A2N0Z0E2_9BACI|nr:transketolase [Niallia nealsonii]PKG22975.1 transketolase [Niallia nealsonii]